MDWWQLAGTGTGILLSGVAAYYGLRSDRRSTERSIVEWYVATDPDHRGKFDIINQGQDSAYKVTVEVWTKDELRKAGPVKEIPPSKWVRITLPKREKYGPDPVPMPPEIIPDPGEVPPSQREPDDGGLFANELPQRDAQWRIRRESHETSRELRSQKRREAEATQVEIRVIWSSKRGRWSQYQEQTG